MQQYFQRQIFSVFYYNTLYWFFANGEKYANVIDDDICNRKIEFNAKSQIMKMNRNYTKVDKKI